MPGQPGHLDIKSQSVTLLWTDKRHTHPLFYPLLYMYLLWLSRCPGISYFFEKILRKFIQPITFIKTF